MMEESCPDFGILFLCGMENVAVLLLYVRYQESCTVSFTHASTNSDKKLLKSFANVSMLRKAEQKETIYNGQTNT